MYVCMYVCVIGKVFVFLSYLVVALKRAVSSLAHIL